MDSFEANKVFGAVLGTVFVLFGGSLIAETIFHSETPQTPGYAIEVAEDEGGGNGAEAPAAVSIAVLLQSADAEAGATVFRRCQSCHSPEEGAPSGVGPHMWGVVNRVIAEDPGFSYSTAMEAFSEDATVIWDYEHLNGFLTNPRQYVPGTSMGFAGISNDGDRANLIAYLRTLSHDPAPLPEPPAEEPEAAAEGEEAAPATEDAAPATEGEEAAPADEAAPAADEEVTDPAATTDPTASPQSPATTDPSAGAAPASEAPTTGEATDADAAEPNLGEEVPAAEEAPAQEEAPAAPAPAPGPTTIVPAPQQ